MEFFVYYCHQERSYTFQRTHICLIWYCQSLTLCSEVYVHILLPQLPPASVLLSSPLLLSCALPALHLPLDRLVHRQQYLLLGSALEDSSGCSVERAACVFWIQKPKYVDEDHFVSIVDLESTKVYTQGC